jgi:transposase
LPQIEERGGMSAGRPSSLTSTTKRTIIESIRAGAYLSTACQIAGVTERTFYNWIKRGQQEGAKNKEYKLFFQSVTRVIAETEGEAVGQILRAGKMDWRAVAWFLSRRHRKRWG